jgi:hypothetical protein
VAVLLREAGTAVDAEQRRRALYEVRDVMEGFKAAELQNYFLDEYVTALQDRYKPAEHAQIHSDPRQSFLLTYDDKITLGLAAVAVKAGVRSVMASLWSVNDASTAKLVPLFFENLKNPNSRRLRCYNEHSNTCWPMLSISICSIGPGLY